MDSTKQFVDGVLLSRHNYFKLEELARDALEADQIMSIVFSALDDCKKVEMPVGLLTLLQYACGQASNTLTAIQTYQGCVLCGSDFDVPFD